MEATLVRFEDREEVAPPQHKNFVTRTLIAKAVTPALTPDPRPTSLLPRRNRNALGSRQVQ
ncbi:MAG: hypothetical protein ACE5JS_18195 [Nitrospinota bacterium]